MSQLNMDFPVHANVKSLRRTLAAGDLPSLQKRNRKTGLVCTVVGAIGVVIEILRIIEYIRNPAILNGRFPGSQILGAIGFAVLFIYGIRTQVNPESHRDYNVHYLGLVEAVTRNTGYPQRTYVPEQWEIPVTQYSPEALANILRLVGGWGEDNICFICNKETHGYHSRNVSFAYIFNQCEKGIFLVPIWVDNGAYKAYADLTIAIPFDAIEKIYTTRESFPRKDSIGLSIYTKNSLWDPNVRLSRTGGYIFNIDGHIDGAPFHDDNVNRIYTLYRNNLQYYLKNQYNH